MRWKPTKIHTGECLRTNQRGRMDLVFIGVQKVVVDDSNNFLVQCVCPLPVLPS